MQEENSSTPAPQEAQVVDSPADSMQAGFDEVRSGKSDFSTPAPEPQKDEASPAESAAAEQPKADAAAPPGDRTTAAAPKTDAPKPNEWEGVPDKVKSEIESMRERLGGIDRIDQQLRTIHGHIGGQASQLKAIRDALVQAKTSTEAKGGEAPTQAQVIDSTKSTERWKQLREDFPDWAEAMDERLAEMAKTLTPAAPVDTSKLRTEVLGDVDTRIGTAQGTTLVQARTLAYLDLKHEPGWEADVTSPEYDAWIKTQPADVQKLSASPRVVDASKLITLYRDHKAKQAKVSADKTEREARLKRAITPEGTKVYERTEDAREAMQAGFNEVRGGGG